jgi:hypothetical protein
MLLLRMLLFLAIGDQGAIAGKIKVTAGRTVRLDMPLSTRVVLKESGPVYIVDRSLRQLPMSRGASCAVKSRTDDSSQPVLAAKTPPHRPNRGQMIHPSPSWPQIGPFCGQVAAR